MIRGAGAVESTKQRRSPTMADVAALAGVSPQTVSRVLRGSDNVAEATRSQVESAAEQLRYRRTGFARALVTGRSLTIGVLTHETDFYARSSILLGAQQGTRDRGYHVSSAGVESLDPSAVAEAIERLRDQGVDGIVLAVPIWDEGSVRRVTDGLPTAVIDAAGPGDVEGIMVDQEAAGRLATDHLLDLGHETVWHISGPTSWKGASGRTLGWSAALRDRDRVEPPILYGDWSPESGYRNGTILARMPEATAVFVSSDEMAFGVIRALAEHGRRVPEDVSVVGMDDIALAQFASPPLTTIHQPFAEMARTAVHHVIDLIDDPTAVHPNATVRPELKVRGSSSAPHRSGQNSST